MSSCTLAAHGIIPGVEPVGFRQAKQAQAFGAGIVSDRFRIAAVKEVRIRQLFVGKIIAQLDAIAAKRGGKVNESAAIDRRGAAM